jgi:hypothetical protein
MTKLIRIRVGALSEDSKEFGLLGERGLPGGELVVSRVCLVFLTVKTHSIILKKKIYCLSLPRISLCLVFEVVLDVRL